MGAGRDPERDGLEGCRHRSAGGAVHRWGRVEVEVPPGATPRASPAAAQSTHAPVDAHSLSAAAGGVPPSGGRWLWA